MCDETSCTSEWHYHQVPSVSNGVLVAEVISLSPAEAAGIKAGDVLIAYVAARRLLLLILLLLLLPSFALPCSVGQNFAQSSIMICCNLS